MPPVPRKPLAALSDTALVTASSRAIFGRGQTYAAGGAVGPLRSVGNDPPQVAATVEGTQPYAVRIWVGAEGVDGECDCPNAADGWFCKHLVAVALQWRAQLSGEAPETDVEARKKVEATVKRAQTVRDRRQALEAFVRSRSASELATRLLEFADRDRAIARDLQQWHQLSTAPKDLAGLKAVVTQVLAPSRGFLDWNETADSVRRGEAVLPLLAELRSRSPADALPLGCHALQRVWAALAHADDSSGEIGGLAQAVGGEWLAALQAAGPQPAAFGETWLGLQLDDPIGVFPAADVEAALGPAALERYRSVLARQWREARAADPGRRRGDGSFNVRLAELERLHLRQLEAQGDVDGMLAVLRADPHNPQAWHRITALLERHGREREAFANAERACKAFPSEPGLKDDLLRCYERDGWFEEALALRRARFVEWPNAGAGAGRGDGRAAGGARPGGLAGRLAPDLQGQAQFRRRAARSLNLSLGQRPARAAQVGVGVPAMRSYFRKYLRASATSWFSLGWSTGR